MGGQAQGDGYLHYACMYIILTIPTVQNTTNGNADYLLQLLHPHFQNVHAINVMEIYVLRFNCSVYVSCPAFPPCMSLFPLKKSLHTKDPEPEFVILLRSPGIDSQPGGPLRQPYLTYRPARLHRLDSLDSVFWQLVLSR